MNKKIKEFFEERNFIIEGNNAYGTIGNYEASVNVAMLDNISPIKIQLCTHIIGDKRIKLSSGLRKLKFKYFRFELNLYGVVLGFNGFTINSLLKQLPSMLDAIVKVLDDNGALGIGYCPLCGHELVAGYYKTHKIDFAKISIDDECVVKLNKVINKENEDFDKKPNNYFKGILGALVGAVVGSVAYLILASFGFISAISAFLAVYLGALLYKKFGGKPTKMMILIVSLIAILSQLLTVFLVYYNAASVLAAESNFASTGMDAFKDMMTVADFSTEFYYNLGMTVLFALLGVGAHMFSLLKSTKRKTTVGK